MVIMASIATMVSIVKNTRDSVILELHEHGHLGDGA